MSIKGSLTAVETINTILEWLLTGQGRNTFQYKTYQSGLACNTRFQENRTQVSAGGIATDTHLRGSLIERQAVGQQHRQIRLSWRQPKQSADNLSRQMHQYKLV